MGHPRHTMDPGNVTVTMMGEVILKEPAQIEQKKKPRSVARQLETSGDAKRKEGREGNGGVCEGRGGNGGGSEMRRGEGEGMKWKRLPFGLVCLDVEFPAEPLVRHLF